MSKQAPFSRSFGLALPLGLAIAAFLALAAVPASALAAETRVSIESFGPDGIEATHFETPTGIAVDQETHDVYVAGVPA
jgi:hypothetical protein